MMKLRLNIVCSLVVHAAIITTALTLVGRDRTSLVPADQLKVILVSGLPEIKSLNAMDQKKQAILSPVSSTQNKAVSGLYDYGATVRDKASPATGREDSHIISSVTETNTEERNTKESLGATVGQPGTLNASSVPSASLSAGYQNLPSGDLGQNQAKTQSKGKNSEDVMAIRKAIEKALVYPLFAKKRGLEGTALTDFTVNAKGYPEDIRIIDSSGHNILDKAAKESLIKAAPFLVRNGRYEIPITFRLKIN